MDSSRYRIYEIPKRSGGTRRIEAPDDELKALQKQWLRYLKEMRIGASKHAHGFINKRSIATHATNHVGKKAVMRIDIRDFFPSIRERQVVYALMQEGIAREMATEIADICTLNGRLPQGAPTSPFLSNLVFKQADYRLAGLARKFGATYSRYADDLIFSFDDNRAVGIHHPVRSILEDCGFDINEKKFAVLRRKRRQMVTGVVVNDKMNVKRSERRNLRAAIHNAKMAVINGEPPGVDMNQLRGRASFIYSINRQAGEKLLRELDNVVMLQKMREDMLNKLQPTERSEA
jgi:RNA-directed DNA polymerase